MIQSIEVRDVQVLGERDWIGIEVLCRLCRLEVTAIEELADLGLVRPRGPAPREWQLPATALPQLAMIGRLMRDLGVNVSGAVLAVELLESRRELERRVRELERQVSGGDFDLSGY